VLEHDSTVLEDGQTVLDDAPSVLDDGRTVLDDARIWLEQPQLSCEPVLSVLFLRFMAAKKQKAAAGSTTPLQADPLPKQGAPQPPLGFAPAPKGQRRPGALPTTQQVRDAADVARELTTSSSYGSDFGARVPSAKTIGTALTLAKGWSDQLAAVLAWESYVRSQYDAAWRAALGFMKQLSPEFKLAAQHDPAVSTTYPQTKDFLGVRQAAATRGAQTRAQKKKAAAKKAT
jgi:hypothetical protein